jgi:hypothetical protein
MKNLFALRVLLCVVAALPAALSPTLAMSATVNPTFTIVNTTANPVPVRGTVTVGNTVVPVEVRNAEPILVNDVSGAGSSPTRFGPVSYSGGADAEVIPTVPVGKVFVVTSLHATLESFISSSPLSAGDCIIFIGNGTINRTSGGFVLQLSRFTFFGNLALSLPLKAGESLTVSCHGTPGAQAVNQGGAVTATGYFASAPH